jgi:hypothetical protein
MEIKTPAACGRQLRLEASVYYKLEAFFEASTMKLYHEGTTTREGSTQ